MSKEFHESGFDRVIPPSGNYLSEEIRNGRSKESYEGIPYAREEIGQDFGKEFRQCSRNGVPQIREECRDFYRYEIDCPLDCRTESVSEIVTKLFRFFGNTLEPVYNRIPRRAEPRNKVAPKVRDSLREETTDGLSDISTPLCNSVPMLNDEDDKVGDKTHRQTNQRSDARTDRAATSTDDSTNTRTGGGCTRTDKETVEPVNARNNGIVNTNKETSETDYDCTDSRCQRAESNSETAYDRTATAENLEKVFPVQTVHHGIDTTRHIRNSTLNRP